MLAAKDAERLRSQSCTYADVGATARDVRPAGYQHFTGTRLLPPGASFDRAGELLITWQVQERAGLRIAASSARAAPDEVVVMRLGPGPLSLRIPCRVVDVVDEPDRRGCAYGTLPGHPESGEEAFVLRRRDDGRLEFTITAFSRPATAIARIGGPLSRGVQRLVTARYLRTLDR